VARAARHAPRDVVTVWRKREGYRRAFGEFDPDKVAPYSERQIQKLTSNPEIIRNRMKIEGEVRKARAFLEIQEEFRDFDSYCWRFVEGQPKLNHWRATRQIPSEEKTLITLELEGGIPVRGIIRSFD
jgi:DNA-3-methyladenine glycosylase I